MSAMATMDASVRALFLDRDGVINHDAGYTHRWEDFVFVDGIFDLGRHAHAQGFLLIVVTNQAGIGRGYYSEDDFHALTARMCARFSAEGAPIAKVYFDPTHPTHGIGDYRRESPMRKPNPGMLLRAAEEFGISLADSVLIGDKASDIEAGLAAGVRCNLLYRYEHGHDGSPRTTGTGETAVIARLLDALPYLVAPHGCGTAPRA
jgi:D-glycero-D-manno-heptose 1,7-bisphosphate phosphatase